MLPFRVQFRPGPRTYEQVVYAVKKAILAGALRPGDGFPSVRAMSHELGMNPATAQKVVAALVQEQLLRVVPGVGTVVTEASPANQEERRLLLGPELERLIVEAQGMQVDYDEFLLAAERHWQRLKGKKPNENSNRV